MRSDAIGYLGMMGLDPAEMKPILNNVKLLEVHMFEGINIGSEVRKAICGRVPKSPVIGEPLHRRCVLVNITGGMNLEIKQCQKIVKSVTSRVGLKTRMIWGARIVPKQKGIRTTVLVGWR